MPGHGSVRVRPEVGETDRLEAGRLYLHRSHESAAARRSNSLSNWSRSGRRHAFDVGLRAPAFAPRCQRAAVAGLASPSSWRRSSSATRPRCRVSAAPRSLRFLFAARPEGFVVRLRRARSEGILVRDAAAVGRCLCGAASRSSGSAIYGAAVRRPGCASEAFSGGPA